MKAQVRQRLPLWLGLTAALLIVGAVAIVTTEVHASVDERSVDCGYGVIGTLFDPVAGTPLWDLPPSPEIGPCAHEAARRLVVAEALALIGLQAGIVVWIIARHRRALARIARRT